MREVLPPEGVHGWGVREGRILSALAHAVVLLENAQGKLLQQLRLMGHYAAVGADLQRKGASQGTFSVPWVSHPEHLPLLQHERCDTVQTG